MISNYTIVETTTKHVYGDRIILKSNRLFLA